MLQISKSSSTKGKTIVLVMYNDCVDQIEFLVDHISFQGNIEDYLNSFFF